jgi:ribulose bisphosphate carboxylase small subunit
MNEQRMETVSQFDIDHSIFKEVSDRKEQMYELFEFCYSHVYRPGYEFFHSFKPGANNFSNFTKLDSNYQNYVFRQLCNDCRDGLPGDYAKILTKYLYVPTEEEKGKDQELLDKYVNVIYVDAEADTNVPEEIIAKIKDALIEYRTKTYKSQHLKAYEIFRNASADRIAKFAPTSIEDLESLRCLDKTQLENYGV